MPRFFNIELLPARHGDCLWIEYGTSRTTHRILIDGGPVATFKDLEQRIAAIPADERAFELVMLSHVDADHVEGLVRLFAEKPLPVAVKRVWFNGWRQMNGPDHTLGPLQGEFLSALLVDRVPGAWNQDAPPWCVPLDGKLPVMKLPGDMSLTLLSPNPTKLK
jgi:glyoxylase-like metal-dependent hydrolase (beta-lactamase superfamily II)